MARYHLDNRNVASQQNLASTYKTLSSVAAQATGLCRGRAVGLAVGTDGAPNATDCAVVYAVQRQTAAGTASTAAAFAINPADTATRSLVFVNYTSEGTYTSTAPVWIRSLNQRASMQWTAPDTDANLTWPATTANGLALVALSPTYASTAVGAIEYEDL